MLAVPEPTPVITPVELFTVATPAASELHVPPLFPFDVKVVVPPTQIDCVPLTVPALGGAVTFTMRVAVTLEQPPVPVNVYVMVADPAAMPEMAPVDALTVATAALLVDQVPPPQPLLKKVVVPPIQISCVPPTVPALGGAVTVTERVAVAFEQPPVPVTV